MPGYIIILHKCTKIIIQDYTVPEIWHMMDVIIFYFFLSFALLQPKKLKLLFFALGSFLPFYPTNSQKKKKLQKNEKRA